MTAKEKLEGELAKLKAAIAAAEDDNGDDGEGEADPEELAADVTKKAAKEAGKKHEIAGASEATMQAFLEETRKVRGLLEGGKISAGKAKSLFSGLFDIFGGGE